MAVITFGTSFDVDAIFGTQSGSNHNSNKRKPVVKASQGKKKKRRGEVALSQKVSAEEDDQSNGPPLVIDVDEERVSKIADEEVGKKIGSSLQDYLTNKYIKGIRDPIQKNINTHFDSYESRVLPKLQVIINTGDQAVLTAQAVGNLCKSNHRVASAALDSAVQSVK